MKSKIKHFVVNHFVNMLSFGILLFMTNFAFSQNGITITPIHFCENQGGFNYQIDPNQMDVNLPFVIKYKLVGSSNYAYFKSTSYTGSKLVSQPGVYEILIPTSDVCLESRQIEILPPIPIDVSYELDCQTSCINLSINSGTSPFKVNWLKWSPQSGTYHPIIGWPKSELSGNDGMEDLCIEGLGKYKAIIIDATCKQAQVQKTIVPCECNDMPNNFWEMQIVSVVNSTNVISCDGSLEVIAGNFPNFTFDWTGPNDDIGEGQLIDNLCPGIYNCTAISSSGCTTSREFVICTCEGVWTTEGEPDGIQTEVYIESTCDNTQMEAVAEIGLISDEVNGSINLTVSGGTNTKSYQWSDSSSDIISNDEDIYDLNEGTYTVTISDGCQQLIQSYSIRLCGPETCPECLIDVPFLPIVVDACEDQQNGEIRVLAGNFIHVSWADLPNQTQSIPLRENLPGAEYCAIVKNTKNNCKASFCTDITDDLDDDIRIQHVYPSTCEGTNDGKIKLEFINYPRWCTYKLVKLPTNQIVKSYTFSNLFFQIYDDVIENLQIGNYRLDVNLTCGRAESYQVSIGQKSPTIYIDGIATDGLEGGGLIEPQGKIETTITGGFGEGTYTINWFYRNNSSQDFKQLPLHDKIIDNLISGTYKIVVQDNWSGCIYEKVFNIHNTICFNVIGGAWTFSSDPAINNQECGSDNGTIWLKRFFAGSGHHIFSHQFPYEITLTGINVEYKEVLVINNLSELDFYIQNGGDFNKNETTIKFTNLISGKYSLDLKNACGFIENKIFQLCTDCLPGEKIYYLRGEDDLDQVQGFAWKDKNGKEYLSIDMQCPCENDGCKGFYFSSRTLIKVHFRNGCDNGINSPQCALKWKITWPDGSICTIENNDVDGNEYYILKDDEIDQNVQVLVEREDCPSQTIEFTHSGRADLVPFCVIKKEENAWLPRDAYICNYICGTCSIKTGVADYLFNDDYICLNSVFKFFGHDINDNGNTIDHIANRNGTDFFQFIPDCPNADDPCRHGGILQAIKIVGNDASQADITILPDCYISTIFDYHPTEYLFNNPLSSDIVKFCTNGGGCLFDGEKIFGIPFDRPVLAPWCSESSSIDYSDNDLPDCPYANDRDCDGIPDSTDDQFSPPSSPCDDDEDCDGILDDDDSCPFKDNTDGQNAVEDTDYDGVPDFCDNWPSCDNNFDDDQDGVPDDCDEIYNDKDDDGIPDDVDNCDKYNPSQKDYESDGHADACDNCPYDDNPGQEDGDQDGQGNACENVCPIIVFLKNPFLNPARLRCDLPWSSTMTIVFEQGGLNLPLMFNVAQGISEIDIQLNGFANAPLYYTISFDAFPNCNDITGSLHKLDSYTGDDDDGSEELTICGDPHDVTFDNSLNQFVYWWEPDLPQGPNLYSEKINKNLFLNGELSRITFRGAKIIAVKSDNEKNAFIASIKEGRSVLTKMDTLGNVLYEKYFDGISFYTMYIYETESKVIILGYQEITNEVQKYSINKLTGTTQSVEFIENGKCDGRLFNCYYRLHKQNEWTLFEYTQNKTKVHWHKGNTETIIELDTLIKVKTATTLNCGKLLIAGYFNGNLSIQNQNYTSQMNDLIFLTCDENGHIENVKVIADSLNQIVTHVAASNDSTVAYLGYASLHATEDTSQMCGYFSGFNLQCADWSARNITTTTGPRAVTYEEYSIYPNPFTNGFTIDVKSQKEYNAAFWVIDNIGRVLYSDDIQVAKGITTYYMKDSEGWPSGIYTIIIKDSEGNEMPSRMIKIE